MAPPGSLLGWTRLVPYRGSSAMRLCTCETVVRRVQITYWMLACGGPLPANRLEGYNGG